MEFSNHKDMHTALIGLKSKRIKEGYDDSIYEIEKENKGFERGGIDHLRISILDSAKEPVEKKAVVQKLHKKGYEKDRIEKIIEELIEQGMLFCPSANIIKTVE
jgi:hypothetical protein